MRALSRYIGLAVVLLTFADFARGEVAFKDRTIDAGEVKAGQPLQREFRFVNQGPEEVEFLGIHTECGCLSPKLEKMRYRRGEEGAILLEVNTLTQTAGAHTWDAEVSFRVGECLHELTLALKGNVVTEIIVEPAAVVVFANGPAAHEVVLTDLRPRPLAVSSVQTSSPKVTARVTEQARDGEGHFLRRIRFEVAADYPTGRHNELVQILTDDPLYRDLKVPVTIVKRPAQRVSAAPAEVQIRLLAGQALPSRIVLLRDSKEEEVVVAGASAEDPAVVCQWAQGPGPMTTLKISVDRGSLAPQGLRTAVHVRLAKPVEEEIVIPVMCTPP